MVNWTGALVETEIGLGPVLIRLLAATVLGGVIGLEREFLARPAGLRTHILVALASASFTIVTLELVHREMQGESNLSLDPTRIVQAVTAGVAFLAAGSIIQSRGRIQGLTTGAGLWLAGAVGTACGTGTLGIAAIATMLGLAVLLLLRLAEQFLPDASHDDEQMRDRR